MKHLSRFIGFILGFLVGWIIFTPLRTKADVNYKLLYNWSLQPANVQQNLVMQNTSITVVDDIQYYDPTLSEVYGTTTMHVYPNTMIVKNIDMKIKKDCEFALSHEVGHCIADANCVYQWWVYRPEFIKIWQEERYNCVLLMGQGELDIREYFACAYDLFIRMPTLLKHACPQTYNYITVVLRYT